MLYDAESTSCSQSEAELFTQSASIQSTTWIRTKKVVACAALLATACLVAFWMAGPYDGIVNSTNHRVDVQDVERAVGLSSDDGAQPFKVTVDGGTCSGGTQYKCDAPGWVYCQDATCSEPKTKNGVLVSECLCWAPSNTNISYAPIEDNAGASCVMNQQNPDLKLPSGGEEMCDAMKKGALVSTYGPKGWKPNLVFNKCPAKTPWAWCWGAPCNKIDGDIICDCPMMISDNDKDQFISISASQCSLETDPCSYVHNGSPNGKEDIQRPMYWVKPDKSCNKGFFDFLGRHPS